MALVSSFIAPLVIVHCRPPAGRRPAADPADLAEFKLDEATTSRSALAIAHEGRFPAIGGVSARGPHNPPLMNYSPSENDFDTRRHENL